MDKFEFAQQLVAAQSEVRRLREWQRRERERADRNAGLIHMALGDLGLEPHEVQVDVEKGTFTYKGVNCHPVLYEHSGPGYTLDLWLECEGRHATVNIYWRGFRCGSNERIVDLQARVGATLDRIRRR